MKMKKPKPFVTLPLARQDAITICEALRTHTSMQITKGFPNEAAVSRHLAAVIAEAINA
jgi:hypothetical protein